MYFNGNFIYLNLSIKHQTSLKFMAFQHSSWFLVTLVFIALYTIQIVSKQLYSNNQENNTINDANVIKSRFYCNKTSLPDLFSSCQYSVNSVVFNNGVKFNGFTHTAYSK